MELFANLAHGFAVAFSPINLLMCLIGALVGTLVGVLPGIGTIATVAMLLPITFGLPPVGALIMLARHLLRRPVWRLDHVDPGQHTR
ncbi:TctA family transporter [Bradyrhizobium sp. i1.3.1]